MAPKSGSDPMPVSKVAASAVGGAGPKFVKFQRQARVKKRNQQPSNLWVKAPGTLLLNRTSEWDLNDNGKDRHIQMDDQIVRRISVGCFEGDDRLYFWAAEPDDSDAFKVDRGKKGQVKVNIVEFLMAHGLVRPVGTKDKFDVMKADAPIEGGPALCINLDKPIQRTTFKTTRPKKKKSATAPDPNKDSTTASGESADHETK